jgi:hypothetical protein
MFSTSLTHTRETINITQVAKITEDPKVIRSIKSHIISDEEKWFWDNSTDNHKQALIFAFYLRKINNHKKVPNVETTDWTKNRKFLEKYEELMTASQWRKIGEPTNMIEAMIRTQGKHFRNLRFGHIHLTLDLLEEKKPVWGIHWDSSTIKSLDAREILTHWINDDMPS